MNIVSCHKRKNSLTCTCIGEDNVVLYKGPFLFVSFGMSYKSRFNDVLPSKHLVVNLCFLFIVVIHVL